MVPIPPSTVGAPSKKVEPITIHAPSPFPFKDTKAVPWKYGATVYIGNKPTILKEPSVTSIAGPSGMTRSGRVFQPDMSAKKVVEADPPKGKDTAAEGPSKRTLSQDDDKELLKIIKKSDYKVVDQLNQTPSKISILSLLMSSEAHRTALLKFLNEAYVEEDISVNQFDHVVANLSASNCLAFTDEEMPPKGREHNMAFHISIKCVDVTLSRVLVDTGSSLNVLPKVTLAQLRVEGTQMRASALVVKAFDGSKRMVIGEVDLPILIGPQVFQITFQVMEIMPAYSCLLGRPWIHASGAVTSTLHQKLKFVVETS